MKIRVGLGFDVHPLKEGHDFWLGGIKIPASKGAVGHSDADVLIHAICDALLGAANLGDIGTHFSDLDQKWKNMDSKFFLKEVTRMLHEKGWKIENVDCTLTLEEPKIKPHIPDMRKVLASLMSVTEEEVSIKATTNEKLGYVGRQEGVNASAVALISKI
ncbi:MAG: 2-C-methyl-D-erythritol 2,4-cyclodiphosphate synthase [Cyclobacteriaceae bacterium]|nr:2-C-methyl-D-erythritol 2,4-cyclodiphosphate synthase [Cyclobacteriaceae bacterium]